MSINELDSDAIVACADLVGRSGAKNFEIGYLHDDVPIEEAGWYAHAQYRGARITAENKKSPDVAAETLARKILDGGLCTFCARTVTTIKMNIRGDRCLWYRRGARWVSRCKENQ